MKKTMLGAFLMVSAGVAGSAQAVDGTINFTGTVTADTCTVAINDQTNPTLNLGTVNVTDLAAQGDTGPATDFTLSLSACPSTVTTASVMFSGDQDTGLDTAFKNETSALDGGAGNVGVQLYDGSQKQISPDQSVDVSGYLVANTDGTSSSAQIPFSARMIAVGDTATAGALVSHADYTINYQ
ncbi:type 1 fimbrial protein [Salmonella enterica]|nr:type 1 fimbrial protein [Salmonella enterica]